MSLNTNYELLGQQVVGELLRAQFADPRDLVFNYGDPVSRRIKKSGKVVPWTNPDEGDEGGLWYKFVTGDADSVRFTRTVHDDFRLPGVPQAGKFRVRFDTSGPANNDIPRIDASIRTTILELQAAGRNPATAEGIVSREVEKVTRGIKSANERAIHADENMVLGTMDGPPKLNSGTRYAGATAYSSGATTVRIKIAGLPIGYFKRGVRLDFYHPTTSTKLLDECEIIHCNEDDQSVSIKISARTTNSGSANFDAVESAGSGCRLVMSGEFGQGHKGSFGAMFKSDYSGESWFGGIDRSLDANSYLLPIMINEDASSSVAMNTRFLDRAYRALSQRMGEDKSAPYMAVIGEITLDNFRNNMGDGVLSSRSSGSREKLVVGERGLMYVHGSGDEIDLVSTHTARNDRCILVDPERMETVAGGFEGWHWASENSTGIFDRVEGSGANGEGTTKKKAEGLAYFTYVPRDPHVMSCIDNLM